MTDTASFADVGLLRIDHVGVAVPDLDAAIEFYARVFGMRCVHEETNEEQGVREAMLAVGADDGGRVQLLAPLRPDSPIGKFLDRHGPGVQQVAYAVADMRGDTPAPGVHQRSSAARASIGSLSRSTRPSVSSRRRWRTRGFG